MRNSGDPHLHDELARNAERVTVETRFGPVKGGRAANGAAVFLEIPYALPPTRFEDPVPLPEGYRYEDKEYIREATYAVQPSNDGQAQGSGNPLCYGVKPHSPRSVGSSRQAWVWRSIGNPLFVNIVAPPSFPSRRNFPVRVYIHGGFLQFGSPHHLSGQAQYISAETSEVWVNIGYRLSAFGFLGSEKHGLTGNYGFKDQWLALGWIRENISGFGGNPEDVQITGLSAGAHSVHQLLHHASQLAPGRRSPFTSAQLQSNAIISDHKPAHELDSQFEALCRGLLLDPDDADILISLKDPKKTPWQAITKLIDSERLGSLGTFRGCLSSDWILESPGPMEWQRFGWLANGLKEHGVVSVVVGDLTEEWYLYSIAHPINGPQDILPNLLRYFPPALAKKLMEAFPPIPTDASAEVSVRRYGDIMSWGQVHLPARILSRDLSKHHFPVLRYEIRWTPEQLRPLGYVTHACDRSLWALRLPSLQGDQDDIAKAWIKGISAATNALGATDRRVDPKQVFTLKEDRSIGWAEDEAWDKMMNIAAVIEFEEPHV